MQMEAHFSLIKILERLTDHINSVLNCPTAVSDDDVNRLPQNEQCSAEIFKAGRLLMTWKLTELWRKAILQELKDASIIHLNKRKGNPRV